MLCGMVLLAASIGKFGGCALAAKANGMTWRESATIGVMMNTRALMELIVVNVGYDLGIIPRSVFFMLVVMALTTYVTTPVLRRLVQSPTSAEGDLERLRPGGVRVLGSSPHDFRRGPNQKPYGKSAGLTPGVLAGNRAGHARAASVPSGPPMFRPKA